MSPTMSGLLLRLAGPLQAWGERGVFHHRDTSPLPTRSALIGMFAAAQGRPRDQILDPYLDLPGSPSPRDLTFTVRVDRPGTVYRDFHTVGGGRSHKEGLRTASGAYRAADQSTLVSHRDYLVGAVFTVAVQGPAPLITLIADTLTHPVWAPFLGRKACPPEQPLVLRTDLADPIRELHHAPLTLARPPAPGQHSVAVDFWWEQRPAHHPHPHPDREATAEPQNLTREDRRHLPRLLWRTREQLPARLYAGPTPIDALTDYALGDPACRHPY